MKRPESDDIALAIDWLVVNDGEESAACQRVARWLENLMADDHLRRSARAHGIPVSVVRARIAKMDGGS